MTILTYDDTFEGLLTAVFEIYERKLGIAVVRKIIHSSDQLFASTLHVISDDEKAARVWKKIQELTGKPESELFWRAWLSEIPDIEDALLGCFRYLFEQKKSVLANYGNEHVLRLQQTVKVVNREKHRMEAFVRFQLTSDQLYYAVVEPDFDVLPLIIKHFESRFADQKWLIYDLKRKYGIYYDLHQTITVDFSFEEGKTIVVLAEEQSGDKESLYQLLWKDYFKSVNIQSRKNTKLHVRHVPKRYWKYLTEKIPDRPL